MSIEFGPSNTLKSVVIGSKDGVIFEWFSYSNGIFSPVDRSVIQKTNAFSSDVKQLFKPEHIKSTTPQRFGDEAQELVEKYQKSKK